MRERLAELIKQGNKTFADNYDEVKETRYGNKLLKYIRKRRRITNLCTKILDKI